MTMESAIEKLADSIVQLSGVLAVIVAQGSGEGGQPAETSRRGRPKKDAAADVQEKMQALQDEARGEKPKEVVDAGTGEVVQVGAEPDAAALRLKAKDLGVKLVGQLGEAQVEPLLRKHSGIADPAEKVGFSKVPDAAVPALIADFEALASMAG